MSACECYAAFIQMWAKWYHLRNIPFLFFFAAKIEKKFNHLCEKKALNIWDELNRLFLFDYLLSLTVVDPSYQFKNMILNAT